MKPFLLIILFLVLALALLGSCMYTNLSGNASSAPTDQIATVPMATVSEPPPIANTVVPLIFSDFNMEIETMEASEQFNELEHIIGASYQVIGVEVLQEDNSPVLRVKTRCECAENGSCCNYQHTFVVTIMVLGKIYTKSSFGMLPTPTPGNVSLLQVWCYDHASLTKRLSVPWTDVISFFNNTINGFQLWSKVTIEP